MSCKVKIGEGITEELFDLTDSQCQTLGIDSLMLLPDGSEACGTHACVFQSRDPNWLIKITDDAEDIRGLIRAKGSQHAVNTRAAYRLTGKRASGNRPLFAAVVEKVDQVKGNDRAYLTGVLYERLVTPALRGFAGDRKYSVPQSVRDAVVPECENFARNLGQDPAAHRSSCRAVVNEALDAIEDFMNRGVAFTDVHAGNWGRRRGKLVAIDLGMSKPPFAKDRLRVPALAAPPKRVWPPWHR